MFPKQNRFEGSLIDPQKLRNFKERCFRKVPLEFP
jgi:hypothetical protein